MAKNKLREIVTGTVTALTVGGADQVLLHQSTLGKIPLSNTKTQALFAGATALGGGFTALLSKRDNVFSRIGMNSFVAGTTLLGQSAVHEVNQMMAKKAVSTTTTQTASSGNDTQADASVTTISADATQDTSAGITSASDLSDAFAG